MSKQRKTKFSKVLSMLLAFVMLLTISPMSAFADENVSIETEVSSESIIETVDDVTNEIVNSADEIITENTVTDETVTEEVVTIAPETTAFVDTSVQATVDNPSTLWVIGDSTVSSFTDNYYYPRYGYGTQLSNYIDGAYTVQNLALSGRSSKSYTADPEYQTLLTGMKAGDYLLIGFGHNDEKTEADRYTNPNGTYQDEGSFANSLYKNYIQPAEAAGCKVILCTPIVRRPATGVWTDSYLHITSTVGDYPGGDYPKAIRDLGTTLSIPVVDMTVLTKNLYDQLGSEETINLHAWTSSKSTSVDNTHTNIWGGKYNAYLATRAIKELNISGLSEHILDATAPTKADSLVSNPNYKEPTYTGDLPQSELWADYGIWKGSVFGNVGGVPTTTNFTLETDANNNMHMAVRNNKGKIASTVDGLAMYYYKVPADSNFTLTAKAKINSFDVNSQVAFGLMARDEMYVDYNTLDAMGDYVVAGPIGLNTPATATNCFARKSGVLTKGPTCVNPIAAGDTVDLKIVGTPDGYSCTFGNETTVSGGFDFKLTGIDSENVFVGMFAARNVDVTYSDIKLIVDGKEVVADETGTTEKTDQVAPASVTGSYTGNGTTFTYTVDPISGAEYSTDNTAWQSSNVFTGIAPNSQVTFYARLKETSTLNASPSTNTGVVTFAKLDNTVAPNLNYNVTYGTGSKTITITEVSGAEYKFGDDAWGTTRSKAYTTDSTVVIQIRYASTSTHNASTAKSESVSLANKEQTAPAKFTLAFSQNADDTFTATIPAVTNGEYSFDGVNFTSTNTKTDCLPETEYTGYVRFKATDGYNVSPVTSDTKTSPKLVEKEKYTLTVASSKGGTATGSGTYTEGEKVILSAVADENYKFVNWTTSGGGTFGDTSSADTSFTMPAKNVTITAKFRTTSTGNISNGNNNGNGGSSVTKKPVISENVKEKADVTTPTETVEQKPTVETKVDKVEISETEVSLINEKVGVESSEVNAKLLEKTYSTVTAADNKTSHTLTYDLSGVELADTSNLVAVQIDPVTGEINYLGGRLEGESTFVTDTKSTEGNFAVIVADPSKYDQVELKVNDKNVSLNGTSGELDAAPVIVNSTTYVPVRVISEGIGATVSYEPTTKTAIIDMNGTVVKFSMDETNDAQKPMIVNDRMLIPVRFVSESLGANVNWFESDKTIQVVKTK